MAALATGGVVYNVGRNVTRLRNWYSFFLGWIVVLLFPSTFLGVGRLSLILHQAALTFHIAKSFSPYILQGHDHFNKNMFMLSDFLVTFSTTIILLNLQFRHSKAKNRLTFSINMLLVFSCSLFMSLGTCRLFKEKVTLDTVYIVSRILILIISIATIIITADSIFSKYRNYQVKLIATFMIFSLIFGDMLPSIVFTEYFDPAESSASQKQLIFVWILLNPLNQLLYLILINILDPKQCEKSLKVLNLRFRPPRKVEANCPEDKKKTQTLQVPPNIPPGALASKNRRKSSYSNQVGDIPTKNLELKLDFCTLENGENSPMGSATLGKKFQNDDNYLLSEDQKKKLKKRNRKLRKCRSSPGRLGSRNLDIDAKLKRLTAHLRTLQFY
ncbi:unnamed protein product [Caenorhabditis auriculariae]|uniref:Uncharacterized protein n=1 Tax=Caenorhabditis auriculariae TaxID=2777116 RepID=A0A8S1H971_9PELO|nr:unnamed protein product [Caenorhabditis auriculariae]